MAQGKLLRFSSPKGKAPELELAFRVVRAFVAKAWPAARFVRLQIGCSEILAFRRNNEGLVAQRALMHMGHKQGVICALSVCSRLPPSFVTGLFLHEFGHLGSGGGELEADAWVRDVLGIRIEYKSALDLEWVPDHTVARILKSVKRSELDLRHNT